MSENETEDFMLDAQDFWTGGLLPYGRVKLVLEEGKVKAKKSDDGRSYTYIGIPYKLVFHEEIPSDDRRLEKGYIEKGWMHFNTLGKSVKQFKSLYAAATGQEIKPTMVGKDGRPKLDLRAIVEELKGLSVYGVYMWSKDENDTFDGRLGWDFKANLNDLYKPVNRYIEEQQKTEESFNDDDE